MSKQFRDGIYNSMSMDSVKTACNLLAMHADGKQSLNVTSGHDEGGLYCTWPNVNEESDVSETVLGYPEDVCKNSCPSLFDPTTIYGQKLPNAACSKQLVGGNVKVYIDSADDSPDSSNDCWPMIIRNRDCCAEVVSRGVHWTDSGL